MKFVVGVLLASTAIVAPNCLAVAPQEQSFELSPSSLDEALRHVARQSGREVMYPEDVVANLPAPRLTGRMTADDAIRALLTDSGLDAEFHKDVVIIRRKAPRSRPAIDAVAPELIVTGTRIRGTVPGGLRKIDRETAREQGFTDLGDLARSLPQNFSGGQNPGVVGGGQKDSENANSSSALNLRGLGADATLTLVNGHRVAYDAANQGVDIAAIPLIALDRLEVVADGSSALYGSDAVAGVANLILRRDYDGAQADVRLAVPTRGDGLQRQASLLLGRKWAGGGFMAAADHLHADAIQADQRDFTRVLDPSATLVPGLRQTSIVAAAHQTIGPDVEFSIDVLGNRRHSRAGLPFFAPGDVSENGNVTERLVSSLSASPSLTLSLAGAWEGRLSGTHAISVTRLGVETNFAGSTVRTTRVRYRNTLASAEAGAEGPLGDLAGGDARLAVGAGWRGVGFKGSVEATTIAGVSRPIDVAQREDVLYAYGELSFPLVGEANARALLRRLQVNAALRYERYSRAGGLAVPKVSVRYDPAKAVTLRANWGRSFKAPTLFQTGQIQQGYLLPSFYFDPDPTGGRPVLLLGGSGSDLKAEKARTISAGFDLHLLRGDRLRLSATFFDIRYDDRVLAPIINDSTVFGTTVYEGLVSYPSPAEIDGIVASLPAGLNNQTGAPFEPSSVYAVIDNRLKNVARQAVTGVDVEAHLEQEMDGGGRMDLEVGASYLESDQQLSAGQPRVQRAGTVFDPPHWRGRASIGWNRDVLRLNATWNYIGGTVDNRFGLKRAVGSFASVDLVGTVTSARSAPGTSSWEVALAATNLLDEAPSRIITTNPASPPFDSTNYPAVGRTVSVRLTKRL